MTPLLLLALFEQSAQMSAFLICLLIGLAYILASALLGIVFGHDDDGAGEHLDMDHGGVDSHPTVSIFSPKIIAIFCAGLGGGGAIATIYGASFTVALLCGLATGFGFGALLVGGLRLLHKQQASSDVPTHAAVGQTATVSIAIPANGAGEVTLTLLGQFMTYTARSHSHQDIPKGALVKVLSINGGILIV